MNATKHDAEPFRGAVIAAALTFATNRRRTPTVVRSLVRSAAERAMTYLDARREQADRAAER